MSEQLNRIFDVLSLTNGYVMSTNATCTLSSWIYSLLWSAATFRNPFWEPVSLEALLSLAYIHLTMKSVGSKIWPRHITLSMEIEAPAPPALDKFRKIAFSFNLAPEPGLVIATCK